MTPAEKAIERKNKNASILIRKGMIDREIASVTELANMVGISKSTLYAHFDKPLTLSGRDLYLISLAVGVKVGELFGEVRV